MKWVGFDFHYDYMYMFSSIYVKRNCLGTKNLWVSRLRYHFLQYKNKKLITLEYKNSLKLKHWAVQQLMHVDFEFFLYV